MSDPASLSPTRSTITHIHYNCLLVYREYSLINDTLSFTYCQPVYREHSLSRYTTMLESAFITVDDDDFGTETHDMYKTIIDGDFWSSHLFIT